ncbi:DUF5659 domain-containing protein [Salipaludibacillus sp. CUR1]|uniref:DUF5659 domain-containing protein n=1 Tax=Salipaludibacillus sp. CUR1 TaxID=2820003 RepID=UPI001E32FF9B|nr:DUF5659 domain-containing protein [Salipaludibacillus sp. CUR1]MCE7792634.1 DUF5659 domain-containing protein [Salipaludibacillus sp. CUR1]
MIKERTSKCILSLQVARKLMAAGFQCIDIDMSKKKKGNLVFVFEDSPELEQELNKIMQKGD